MSYSSIFELMLIHGVGIREILIWAIDCSKRFNGAYNPVQLKTHSTLSDIVTPVVCTGNLNSTGVSGKTHATTFAQTMHRFIAKP